MKKKKTIIYIMIIMAGLIISGINIFTFPSMLIRTTSEVGIMDSFVTVKDKERKMHIAKVNDYMVAMEFTNSCGLFWIEDGFEISPLSEEAMEIRSSYSGSTTILYGICKNKAVNSIRIELSNGEKVEADINEDGLFGKIIPGNFQSVKAVIALDQNNEIISQINK